MKAGRRATRGGGRVWPVWLAIILGIGVVAGGFVGLRNTQVQAGHRMKAVEERIAELESQIELYDARLARETSRPALYARLQAIQPDLRPLQTGEAVRLSRPAGAPAEKAAQD